MFSTKKYLPVLAAFVVGIVGAAGYAVHANSTVPNTATNSAAQVQTTAQDPQNLDGETADDAGSVQTSAQDPQQLDGEQADDSQNSVNATADSQEAESGPADSGPDTGEVGG